MSQSDFGVIDPNTKSGTQLAVDLNGFRDAVNSGHSGATRPAYLPAGGHWVRVVSSTQWDLVFYDGSVDYTLRSVNPTTGQKIGIPAADLADKQTSANDNTTGRLLVNPAYGLGTTGALRLPSGTTANRPASPAQFDSRGNSTTGAPEWWSGSAWVPFSGIDYLNTTRINVASDATVNLIVVAPNTRDINITGTTAITAFAIATGQKYFVRFNATLTLTNSASLVTQSGANIVTQAGDTCIIRATSANVVEVLSYVPAGGWAKSLAANGYQKLPSGLIIQWGTTAALSQNSSIVVTLPVAFPNAILNAHATYSQQPNDNATSAALAAIRTSLSQITIAKGANGGSAENTLTTQWLAIGY